MIRASVFLQSLCNACGIRSRKKRRALLGLNKASTEDKKPKRNSDQNISVRKSGKNGKLGESMKRQLLVLQRSTVEKLRKKLGEEEQAAVLLMSLSCGSVYG